MPYSPNFLQSQGYAPPSEDVKLNESYPISQQTTAYHQSAGYPQPSGYPGPQPGPPAPMLLPGAQPLPGMQPGFQPDFKISHKSMPYSPNFLQSQGYAPPSEDVKLNESYPISQQTTAYHQSAGYPQPSGYPGPQPGPPAPMLLPGAQPLPGMQPGFQPDFKISHKSMPYSPNFLQSQGYAPPSEGVKLNESYPISQQTTAYHQSAGYPQPSGYPGPQPGPPAPMLLPGAQPLPGMQPGFQPGMQPGFQPGYQPGFAPGYPHPQQGYPGPIVQQPGPQVPGPLIFEYVVQRAATDDADAPTQSIRSKSMSGIASPDPSLRPTSSIREDLGGWMTIPQGLCNCPPGLEYLSMIDQLLVQQKLEFVDLLGLDTSNKFEIKNSVGQKVYYAVEDNDRCARLCCAMVRRFDMRILDNSGNEVIHLYRPYACGTCLCPCWLQKLEVSAPPGNVIGSVEQEWSICRTYYAIKNEHEEVVLRIKGPVCPCSCFGSDVDFHVYSRDGESKVGKITKQGTGLQCEPYTLVDNFSINFPMDMDVKIKAVLLSACFLIDFMFLKKSAK